MKWYQNPKVLCFAGGMAATLMRAKVIKPPETRKFRVTGMVKGVEFRQDVKVILQNIREDAQDLCAEAKQRTAQETVEEV